MTPTFIATLEVRMKYANCNKIAIDKSLRWSEKWQIPFNISKCKSLHIGRTNPNHVYNMAGFGIEQTVEERDLAILIDNQLKFHDHGSI